MFDRICVKLLTAKNTVVGTVKKLVKGEEEGASMAEYAVLLAIVTAAVIAAVSLLGTNISAVINTVAGRITVN